MARNEPLIPDPSAPPGEELLTTRELMAFLHVSRTKIWELVQREQLPAFKLGGDYRYRRGEVLEWLERYRVNNDIPADDQGD